MQSGNLTVTGEGSTSIPLVGRPREVVVCFKPAPDPTPCNPHHHHDDDDDHKDHHGRKDHLEHRIEHEDEDQREHHKVGHHHHDRKFFLHIKWRVESLREIDWIAIY